MRHKRSHIHRTGGNSWRILLILVLLLAFAGLGLIVSRQLLLNNARIMGKNLVTSYATDEDRNLNEYEDMVLVGMAYLRDLAAGGINPDAVGLWVMDFFDKSGRQLNIDQTCTYVVVDGCLVSSDNLSAYNIQEQAWYQQAMAAGGKVIFTDAYFSTLRNQTIITIAAADPATGNAAAVDLPTEHLQRHHSRQDLPAGGAYYVCDSAGNLLYYNIPFEASNEALQLYVKDLFDRVRAGELDGKHNSITGMQGLQRGLYYQDTVNGWLCILTVPYSTLLQGVQDILVWYGGAFGLFMAVAVGLWLRDRRLSRSARRIDETVQVLGNTYYAVYRVNVATGTYEMTKPSGYVLKRLPEETGPYEELLNVLRSGLDEWTGVDFEQNFSLEHIRQLVEQNETDFGGEFLRQTEEGLRWISVRLLTDPELIPNEAVLCFRDVEKEKEEQQKQVYLLKGALAAAEQSEKSQKQFFSVMSHDMRTPLNIIIGMTGLALQPGCSQEKILDYVHKIDTASQQLLALINDILEISRLEQGNISMDIKSFDLREAMETWASPFQTQAQASEKNFSLVMDVKDANIKGDAARLGQVINNLVSNAIKFTKPGGRVSVSVRQMDEGRRNNYLFIVEDTGSGMSEEFLPKLFDPYEREVRFGAKDVMGTGLGMPIVKNLVTRMGGQISVTSALGKGTTFSVTLPFDVGEAPAPAEKEPQEEIQLEGCRILLAEDNVLNMEIAVELLQMRGAQVTQAENGRVAVEEFQKAEPRFFDAILMDMQMPEMDGCQAAQAIRALDRPDAQSIPIIALTANAFAEDINRTVQAGMNAHLAKPINIEQLCVALNKLVPRREPAQSEIKLEKE